jgi:hypothetical protein
MRDPHSLHKPPTKKHDLGRNTHCLEHCTVAEAIEGLPKTRFLMDASAHTKKKYSACSSFDRSYRGLGMLESFVPAGPENIGIY